MSRLNQINPENANDKARELLAGVQKKLGMTPNMMRAMANSPAVLEAYLQFSAVLGKGVLPAKTREQIALTVGEANGCDYCLAAHSAIGKMVGLSADQIRDARHGDAIDSKSDATLKLAGRIVESRGHVTDADLESARASGLDDAGIAEVVANVALSIFTNYFNHVAETDLDFPAAEPLEAKTCAADGRECGK